MCICWHVAQCNKLDFHLSVASKLWWFPQEKLQLYNQLQEREQRLRLLELTDTTDSTAAKRYQFFKSCPLLIGTLQVFIPETHFMLSGCCLCSGPKRCRVKSWTSVTESNTWTTWCSASRGKSKQWSRRWGRFNDQCSHVSFYTLCFHNGRGRIK